MKELNKKRIAYVDMMEGTPNDAKAGNEIIPAKDLKPNFTAGKVRRGEERREEEKSDRRRGEGRRGEDRRGEERRGQERRGQQRRGQDREETRGVERRGDKRENAHLTSFLSVVCEQWLYL